MGGSSGGGAGGATDFPIHMKGLHAHWLVRGGVDGNIAAEAQIGVGQSIGELIIAGLNNSPYAGEIAFNPDTNIAAMLSALNSFGQLVNPAEIVFDPIMTWQAYVAGATVGIDGILSEVQIVAAVAAYAAQLEDRLTTDTIPKYQTGMRDINAVVSSSFVIGESVLRAFSNREVNDFEAKLRLQQYSQRNQAILGGVGEITNLMAGKLSFNDSLAKMSVEVYRIASVLKKEELSEQLDIDSKEYTWDLSLYQQGANMLGAMSGSTVNTHKGPTTTQSTLGGAMSGAAAGYQMGSSSGYGGTGAAIGAIGGALLGYSQG
jgi:hypothetical protein